MNTRLLVLSPHRDDAVFSLALSLKRWSTAGAIITVLNFFTRSDYAPYVPEGTDISAARAREDARALRAIDAGIRIRSLPLLDAPLRLPIDFGSITNPDVFSPLPEEVVRLGRVIERACRSSLLLAPLGLGEHIDHRTIRDAALHAAEAKRIAFYEDLPYAAWTSESAICERVRDMERRMGVSFFSSLQRCGSSRWKRRAVGRYQSQIDERMADLIAGHAGKYSGAERVWAPRHDGRWRALLSTASVIASA